MAWGWPLAFSGPHLRDCRVRETRTLGAPPAEESQDCIRLRFTPGLDIQGRPPAPCLFRPLSHPASTLQPNSRIYLLCRLISRHQPTSFHWERPPPPCLLPPGDAPTAPSLVCLQGCPQLPSAFPLLPRSRQREALPPLGSQSTLFHHPYNLITLLLTLILSTSSVGLQQVCKLKKLTLRRLFGFQSQVGK